MKSSLCRLAYTLASVVDIINYNSLFQLALIENFHQMSDAQIAWTIQFWEAVTLL